MDGKGRISAVIRKPSRDVRDVWRWCGIGDCLGSQEKLRGRGCQFDDDVMTENVKDRCVGTRVGKIHFIVFVVEFLPR